MDSLSDKIKMSQMNAYQVGSAKPPKTVDNTDVKFSAVKDCKYLLPCGKCDKDGQMCSQYII